MKYYQKGNIFIGIIATIIILTMIYFLFVPQVKKKLNKQQEIPSTLANNLSEQSNIPVPELQKKEYDGAFSWTNKVDITENPFNTEASDIGADFKFKERSKDANINADLKEPAAKKPKSNIFNETPTGYDFPLKSGFLDGYPYNHDKGTLLLTVDNSENKTDLIIYIYRISDVNNKAIQRPTFSRAFYVKSEDKFVINDLQSGVYNLRWLELNTGNAKEYKQFELHKDNKYQYNRYFKFNGNSDKHMTKIPLSAFYPNRD